MVLIFAPLALKKGITSWMSVWTAVTGSLVECSLPNVNDHL